MQDMELTSLSLTTVHYDPTNPISHLSAFLSLTPQVLVITYVALILTTREAEFFITFAGQLACEVLNFGLKRALRHPRPERIRHLHAGYGMPSSHAQFMGFWAVNVILFIVVRYRPWPAARSRSSAFPEASSTTSRQRITPSLPLSLFSKFALISATTLLAAAVAASRVYLSYHTIGQVYVGVGVGIVFGAFWFTFTGLLRTTGVLRAVLDLPLSRAFRLRDLMCEVDLWELGWREWEERNAYSLGTSSQWKPSNLTNLRDQGFAGNEDSDNHERKKLR